MKLLTMFLITVLLAMTAFAAPPVGKNETPKRRRCVPGKSYYDGCNQCWCGVFASERPYCTLMACYEIGTNKIKSRIEPPEDFWMKD